MDAFRLDGKRALVTGGSKGIGAGLARGLADAGADIVLMARHKKELEQARSDLQDTGREIGISVCDVSKTDEIHDVFSEIVQQEGPLDILVNNAGTTRRAPAHELDLDDWRMVIDVNLTAVFALCQAFAKKRISDKQPGKIINIGSLMSSTTRKDNAPYAASKGAVLLLTRALAVDWAAYDIRVNAIGPGFINTPLTEPLVDNPEFNEWVTQRCPQGRWGTPGDLAGAAVFLASPASDFVTGEILYVDGGWLARF